MLFSCDVSCPLLLLSFWFHAQLQKTASLFTGLPWLLSSVEWDADGQLIGNNPSLAPNQAHNPTGNVLLLTG